MTPNNMVFFGDDELKFACVITYYSSMFLLKIVMDVAYDN
jgi:hypothetical protein